MENPEGKSRRLNPRDILQRATWLSQGMVSPRGYERIEEEDEMSEEIIQGTDAGFDQEVLKSDVPVLVDFWAPWCGPCLMMAPLLDEVAQTQKGKLKVVKINVDDNNKTAMTYGVMAIPTLMVFKGGELKEKSVGVVPKAKLAEIVARHV
jgi:thioredoxin 1